MRKSKMSGDCMYFGMDFVYFINHQKDVCFDQPYTK